MAYKTKILVVESDAAALRQLENALKGMEAAPRGFTSGREAAGVINKEKFDGAFLTWDSRDISGEDLTKMIRGSKSNSRIPIAMLTPSGTIGAISAGFKAGVTFFFNKPVNAKELSRLVTASRGAMLEERRKYERVSLRGPVKCQIGDKQATAQCINVSMGGMLLALSPAPPVGTALTVEFKLPRLSAPLELEAEVIRHTDEKQVGVKFTNTSAEDRARLKTYASQSGATL